MVMGDVTLPRTPLTAAESAAVQEQWPQEAPAHRTRAATSAVVDLSAQLEQWAAAREEAQRAVRAWNAERFQPHAETFERCVRAHDSASPVADVLRIAKERDTILAMPDVAALVVERERLVVRTHPIHVPLKKRVYDTGAWEITIPRTATSASAITIRSLRKRVPSYGGRFVHPHVYAEGHVCWGNTSGVIAQFLCAGEYDSALAMIFAVLKSCTPADNQHGDLYENILRETATEVRK